MFSVQGSKKWVMVMNGARAESQGSDANGEAPTVAASEGADGGSKENIMKIIGLRHPRTGRVVPFLSQGDGDDVQIFEIQIMRAAEDKHSSWFLGDQVQEDGSLYMCSKIDPLFLVLPYLTKASQKFCPRDQIVDDAESPLMKMVTDAIELEYLSTICDVKDKFGPELILVKLNPAKLLAWLQAKVRKVAHAIGQDGSVARAVKAQSASTFNSGTASNAAGTAIAYSKLEAMSFAIVKEYLPEVWEKRLSETLESCQNKAKASSAASEDQRGKKRPAPAPVPKQAPVSRWDAQRFAREEDMDKLISERPANPGEEMRRQKEIASGNPEASRKRRMVAANAKAAKGCRSLMSFFKK